MKWLWYGILVVFHKIPKNVVAWLACLKTALFHNTEFGVQSWHFSKVPERSTHMAQGKVTHLDTKIRRGALFVRKMCISMYSAP